MIDLMQVFICPIDGEVLEDKTSAVDIIDVDNDDVTPIRICLCGSEVKPKIKDGNICFEKVDHERWLWANGFYNEPGDIPDDEKWIDDDTGALLGSGPVEYEFGDNLGDVDGDAIRESLAASGLTHPYQSRPVTGPPALIETLLLSDELAELKRVMLERATGFYAPVNQRIIFYIISCIDKEIGKSNRLDFLRWCFDRKEIKTSHLDEYPGGLTNGEAEALLLWAIPFKGEYEGAKWELLNNDFIHHLRLFMTEVKGQLDMFSAISVIQTREPGPEVKVTHSDIILMDDIDVDNNIIKEIEEKHIEEELQKIDDTDNYVPPF